MRYLTCPLLDQFSSTIHRFVKHPSIFHLRRARHHILPPMPSKSTRSKSTPGPTAAATEESAAAGAGAKGRSTRHSTRLGSTTEEETPQQAGQTGFVMSKNQAAGTATAAPRRSGRQPILPRPNEHATGAEPIEEEEGSHNPNCFTLDAPTLTPSRTCRHHQRGRQCRCGCRAVSSGLQPDAVHAGHALHLYRHFLRPSLPGQQGCRIPSQARGPPNDFQQCAPVLLNPRQPLR